MVGDVPTARTTTVLGTKFPLTTTVAFRTTDTGAHWAHIPLPKGVGVAFLACTGEMCTFTNGLGPSGDSGPSSFFTADLGRTWSRSSLDRAPAWRLYGLTCNAEKLCVAVGWSTDGTGLLLYSNDGGLKWSAGRQVA